MGRVYICSVVTVSQLLTANGGLYWQERACEPILVLYIHILFLSCKAIVNMFRFQHFSPERLTYEQNQFLNPAMCMYTWVISRVQICNRQLYHSDIIHHLRSTSVITSIYGVQLPSPRTVCCSPFQHCQVDTPGSCIIHWLCRPAAHVPHDFILNRPRLDSSSRVRVNSRRLVCVCV